MKLRGRFTFYEPAFKLGDGYSFGVELGERVDKTINGGLACAYADVGLLAQAVCRHGDHLEFGTLYGATAIVAAATKKEFGFDGDVYTVDNGQYRAKITRQQNIHFPDDMVMDNAELFGVADRIHVIEADTFPLPSPVNAMKFGSAFIDAGHDFEHCHKDWVSARGRANVIVFHDYDSLHMGVVETVRIAARNPDWWLIHLSHNTAIMGRLHKRKFYGITRIRE